MLSGTLDYTRLNGSESVTAKADHAAFTGVVDREALTLSFPQGLGFSTSISGVLTDDRLSLRLPQDDGSVATVTLRPGSVDDYNRMVAALNDRASANAAASQAAAEAAADQAAAEASAHQAAAQEAADAHAETQARLGADAAAKTVADDIRTLRSALDETSYFGDFAKNIAKARVDLSAAKDDAGKAAEDDSADACSDAYQAQSDGYSVQSDSYSIDSDMYSLTGSIESINSTVAGLNEDFDAYHSAVAGAPGYLPSDPPDEKTIQTAIDTAHSTTADLKNRGNSYKSTVAQLLAQATTIANQAVQLYC